MPITRDHAFANGSIAYRPSALKRIVWRLLSSLNYRYKAKLDIARAWTQFDKFAVVASQSALGPNAWCINSTSDPRSIVFEGRVVCRGLVRIESFGYGRILVHPEVYIGDDCLISCADSVEIGSNTLIAHNVQIFDNTTHPIDWQERVNDWKVIAEGQAHLKPKIAHAPISIGEHVWIGFGSIILKGVTIGDKSIVAAGSVVTHDVPSSALVAGSPAKVIRWLDQVDHNEAVSTDAR